MPTHRAAPSRKTAMNTPTDPRDPFYAIVASVAFAMVCIATAVAAVVVVAAR
jgi:hypothetical protein